MVYFQLGKTTPVNYISIKKMASFRASDAALATPTFIDNIKPGFPFGQPFPVFQQFRRGTLNVSSTRITKYEPGMLIIPDHEVQTGKWLYYVLGGCATTGPVSSVYTHAITEAATLPFLGIHCEMEHETDANSERVDLLGSSIQDYKFSWSQDNPAMQSLGIIVAKDVTGSDIGRPTGADAIGFAKAGYNTVTFEYNGSDAGCTVWGGSINIRNYLEYRKVADVYATESLFNKREYTINLDISLSDDILLDIPDDPESYTGAITLVVKSNFTATHYNQFTFSSLQLDPNSVRGHKIDEDEFFWRGTITLRNCGAIASIPQAAGTLAIEAKDALTIAEYEVS